MGKDNIAYCNQLYLKAKKKAELFKCEPVDWLWMPKPIRNIVAVITLTLFACAFLAVPFTFLFFIPAVWRFAPVFSSIYVGSVILSMLLPPKEWY